MKISVNSPCPCGSGKKYKKCCQAYHLGKIPQDALTVMKSRYSAYATNNIDYIIKTTHPKNPIYQQDKISWREDIEEFCKNNTFNKLTIISYDFSKNRAYVEFIADLKTHILHEISEFYKESEIWLYINGIIK